MVSPTVKNGRSDPARLEPLLSYARERGANDALIIPATEVLVDPRVRFKCMVPKCFSTGTCSHCPPHGLSFRETRELVSRFRWGVFFRVLAKSAYVTEKSFYANYLSGTVDQKGNMLNVGGYCLLVYTIAKLLEKKAGELGYRQAQGFASGNCRDLFCRFQPDCQRLSSGRGCRHPGISIPSMESSGIDALTMAARAGWEVYTVGGSLGPADVPHGTFVGLTLFA